MDNFDRYSLVRINNNVEQLPFVSFDEHPDDKYIEFIVGSKKTRFDILAQKYYNDPTLGFLILMGNPEYISEFDIPDGKIIRIPFPKNRILEIYNNTLTEILNR